MSNWLSLSDKREIEGKYNLYTITGKITFAGAVIKYYDIDPVGGRRISWGWESPSTNKGNISAFKNVLLRAVYLCVGNASLDSFTNDTFDMICEQVLELKPKIKKDRQRDYLQLAAKTYLAAAVGEKDFQRKAYPENLLYDREESITTRKEKLLIRKSFGIDDEIKLLRWMTSLEPESAKGTDIGLMLMFCFGMRNGEVCGLRFSDIHELENGHEAIYVTYSAQAGTNSMQLGGKTINVFRIIPLFPFVSDFIKKRRKYIAEELSRYKKSDDKTNLDLSKYKLNDLKIASGKTIFDRLSASILTAAGKSLFENVLGYDPDNNKTLNALSDDFKAKLSQAGIDEKEPSAYLFRRNFATHLSNLGAEPNQVQYLLGHVVEADNGYQRNFYSTGDELDELCRIMDKHPFQFVIDNLTFNDEKRKHTVSHLISMKPSEGKINFRIIASESFDVISIKWPEYRFVTAKLFGYSIPLIGNIKETVTTIDSEYANYIDRLVAMSNKEQQREKNLDIQGGDTIDVP